MDSSQLLSLNIANQALFNTIRYQVVTGPQGQPGNTGPAGFSTNTGATGAPGTSGFSTNTGATGTAGAAGSAGAPGAPGAPGAIGATGTPGSATNTGSTGPLGITGYTGPTGPKGESTNTGATGPQGIPGIPGLSGGAFGVIKIPSNTSNFNFSTGVSTLPASFGTYNSGSITDGITFTITLNSKYNPSNLPFFNITAYVYSQSAGYIICQRQIGTQSGVAAAYITINPAVTTITLNYISKTNFPYTSNDSSGYALYLCFNIYN
jgi:hypothetical protein